MEQLVWFPEEGSSLWQNTLKRRISLFAVTKCACLAGFPCSQSDMWAWAISLHLLLFSAWGKEKVRMSSTMFSAWRGRRAGPQVTVQYMHKFGLWPQPYCCVWRSYHHSFKGCNTAFYCLYYSNPQECQARSMNHIMPGTAQMNRRALAPDWRPFVSQGVTWPQT